MHPISVFEGRDNEQWCVRLASRLHAAEVNRRTVPADRELSVTDGLAVQAAGLARRIGAGRDVVGYKVGLTSADIRRRWNATEPVFGYLTDDRFADGPSLDSGRFIAPRVEPELAYVLGATPASPAATDVLDAVSHVAPALEIVDSRWSPGSPSSLGALLADNVSASAVVLGPRRPFSGATFTDMSVRLSVGGRTAVGRARTVLGDPAASLAWLAGQLAAGGHPMTAGLIILTGTWCPPEPARPGDHVEADFGTLGRCVTSFRSD